MNLHALIKKPERKTVDILHMWNSIYDDLLYNSKTHTIDNALSYKYRFDFHGLLDYLKIPPEYYYPNTIVNGYSNSTAFTGDVYEVIIVDASYTQRKLAEFKQYLDIE